MSKYLALVLLCGCLPEEISFTTGNYLVELTNREYKCTDGLNSGNLETVLTSWRLDGERTTWYLYTSQTIIVNGYSNGEELIFADYYKLQGEDDCAYLVNTIVKLYKKGQVLYGSMLTVTDMCPDLALTCIDRAEIIATIIE
jgi:hypothetical protein